MWQESASSPLQRSLFVGNIETFVLKVRACACYTQASTPLGGRLQAFAASSALNLRLITAESLSEAFLPHLLPRAWRGQATVAWDPEALPAGSSISAPALLDVWAVLAELPDLAPLAPWPLLPVHARTLSQLSATSPVHSLH